MSKRFSILLVVLTIISGLILCGCASYYAGWTAPYAMINKLQRNMTEQGAINLLGQPSRVEMVAERGHIIKMFLYRYYDASYVLGFVDNKLITWGTPETIKAMNELGNWDKNGRSLGLPSKSSQNTITSTSDVIESYIDGDFEGWDGDTIFKLDNGQIWEQASYSYTYHYSYHPEVTIYKTSGGYKMRVEGVDDTIYVRRLK